MAQPVEIKLAKEEEQPKQEHEIPYFDALVAALSEADRERAEVCNLSAFQDSMDAVLNSVVPNC
jgi:hypothetical protein